MRRIGVISDVHGDLSALQAVLADAERVGCEEIWCLGDTFTGAGAVDCFELVRERCSQILFGNHEEMVLSVGLHPQEPPPSPDSPIGLACDQLSKRDDLRRMLTELRPLETLEAPGGPIVLAHGSPFRPVWHWIKEPRDVDLAFQAAPDAQLILVGHTHVAAFGSQQNGDGTVLVTGDPRLAAGIEFDGVSPVLVNPGSVGQLPQGLTPSWGVLSFDDGGRPQRFDWRRVQQEAHGSR
jgi:predicted phosphodiesterase